MGRRSGAAGGGRVNKFMRARIDVWRDNGKPKLSQDQALEAIRIAAIVAKRCSAIGGEEAIAHFVMSWKLAPRCDFLNEAPER